MRQRLRSGIRVRVTRFIGVGLFSYKRYVRGLADSPQRGPG